jgi:hypothetical protein
MSKRIQTNVVELVIFGILAGFFGAIFSHACEQPAHAGVTDDAAAVRRAVEHMDKVLTKDFMFRHGENNLP